MDKLAFAMRRSTAKSLNGAGLPHQIVVDTAGLGWIKASPVGLDSAM